MTAVVVVKQGHALDEDDGASRTAVGGWPHFKVPKRVVFVESLPKNPSGKLLKRELRARLKA